ncbi:MAG: hypothetical protein Fur0010_07800 [Bdellovibrio sp.]
MNLAEIRKVASTLHKAMFNRGQSFSIGMWKSNFRGNGLQFKEHQVYSYGDEVRFIDWKLTARTNHPYIKTFEEERNINIQIVIDANASMYEGYFEKSKLQSAIEIACLIIILAGKTRDSVSVLVIHESIEEIRGLSGDIGLMKFISFLQKMNILDENGKFIRLKKMSNQPEAPEVENIISRKFARTKELVILSDFEQYFKSQTFFEKFLKTHFHLFRMIVRSKQSNLKTFEVESLLQKDKVTKYVPHKNSDQIKINKKLKDIDISKNHLEMFIGEMS